MGEESALKISVDPLMAQVLPKTLLAEYLLYTCLHFQEQFQVKLQSWFAEQGELAEQVWGSFLCWWVLFMDVLPSSGLGSDSPTDDRLCLLSNIWLEMLH